MDRFIDKGGYILDSKTGLEWRKDFERDMTWEQAMDYAAGLRNGWRLPTVEELITLIDFSKPDPVSSFPDMPSFWFWSSSINSKYGHIRTVCLQTPNLVWYVNFENGVVKYDYETCNLYARCVRSPKEP